MTIDDNFLEDCEDHSHEPMEQSPNLFLGEFAEPNDDTSLPKQNRRGIHFKLEEKPLPWRT